MVRRQMLMSALMTLVAAGPAPAQAVDIPPEPVRWQATDSIRFEPWQGQASLWINKGVALVPGVDLRNGTFEVDVWTGASAGNVGVAFHVRDRNAFEVIFIRPGQSGKPEAVQYAPALNGLGTAWQVYHGDGANAKADIPRDTWVHLAVQIRGDTARFFLDHAAQAILTVPHLVLGPDAGGGIGVWASVFRQATNFANARYALDTAKYTTTTPAVPPGTIADWELSPVFDAPAQVPGKLPALSAISWQKVRAEWPGLVLINRYRAAPAFGAPVDHPDSVLGGRVTGSKVLYARTVIDAPLAGLRRMQIGFSDGLIVYCNGVPLYSGMHPLGLQDNMSYMELAGDAVYLPLKAGKNEIVMAVTEFFGGWAFSARLDR